MIAPASISPGPPFGVCAENVTVRAYYAIFAGRHDASVDCHFDFAFSPPDSPGFDYAHDFSL